MTAPTKRQIEQFDELLEQAGMDYPKTPSAVVGFSLAKHGILAVVILFLMAGMGIEFWYLQKAHEDSLASNARWDRISTAQMEVIKESSGAQLKVAMILSTLTETLNKHQTWEERMLDLSLPKIDHISQKVDQLR